MRIVVFCALVCSALCTDSARAYDIPLEGAIGTEPEGGHSLHGRLHSMEERLIQVAARLETLSHTVDTQLAQLDNSVLQLYKELGSSRLTKTLAELVETVRTMRTSAAAAATSAPAATDLVQNISQEIRQSEQLLQTQLNDSHSQLVSLLEEVRPAVAEADRGSTTVIVERCSFSDRFQTVDQWRPADCAAVQQRHQHSGIYTIFPPVCGNGGGIRVFCDMETDGGGWTVLMRRTSGRQDFNMSWQNYKWGFGNLSDEFWLGNEYVSLLTSMDQMQLRVDLKDWDNASASATYTPFSIGTEQQKYILKVGKYEGTAGNSLAYSNNAKFSTKDQDNDSYSQPCAVKFHGGWWYKSCFEANLAGRFRVGAIKDAWHGVVWKHWKGEKYSLKHVEMKIRPLSYMTWCHRLAKEGVDD